MRLIHSHCTCINIGIVVSAANLLETTGEQMIMDALLCKALDTVTKEEKYQEIPFRGKMLPYTQNTNLPRPGQNKAKKTNLSLVNSNLCLLSRLKCLFLCRSTPNLYCVPANLEPNT